MRPGIYETVYGNTALVGHSEARTAFDLDAGVRIPIIDVRLDKWFGLASNDELVQSYRHKFNRLHKG